MKITNETCDALLRRLGYSDSLSLHKAYIDGTLECSAEDRQALEWKCISPNTLLAVAAMVLASEIRESRRPQDDEV